MTENLDHIPAPFHRPTPTCEHAAMGRDRCSCNEAADRAEDREMNARETEW